MDTKLTREELDAWLMDLSQRLTPEAEAAHPGDIAEIVAGEAEVIEPRVASGDFDYFHDQLSGLIDILVRANTSNRHETTDR